MRIKYTKINLLNQLNSGKPFQYLHFWGHQPSKDGSITTSCFSQWWSGHPFYEEGILYQTAEHYMMAGKAKLFEDPEMLEKILDAKTPKEAKVYGRKVKNFDQETWKTHRSEIVVKGNELKFSQHPDLKAFLLKTRDQVIVEASPRDRIWGIGMSKNHPDANTPTKWRGHNLLGFCLMEVRDLLGN